MRFGKPGDGRPPGQAAGADAANGVALIRLGRAIQGEFRKRQGWIRSRWDQGCR